MNKIAHYLQQHVDGEIVTSDDVLDYFSTDESVFQIRPQLVLYPRSEKDIRKTARFTWQLAEKGRSVTMTARGNGTDQTGAALGDGIIIAMSAHMNKIIELDPKSGIVTCEAGISLDKLQQVLHTHGRFLPAISDVNRYATLGGAVANNDSSRYSYKYGPMQEFVRGLKVVLANGELIETGRLSKRELNKKLGLASYEGELYRSLDKLIDDNNELLESAQRGPHNKAGYNLSDVRQKDGSFDLTPLFLGSQGTLVVISEITIDTMPHSPRPSLVIAGFSDRAQAWKAVMSLNEIKDGPASIDFIDETLIAALQSINLSMLKPLDGGVPATMLFIELDDESPRSRKKLIKKIVKICEDLDAQMVEPEEDEQLEWERLRDSASSFLTHRKDKKQAIPVLDDAQIPLDRMNEFFNKVDGLMDAANIQEYAIWGQAGSGLVHVAPLLDITSVGDRQRLFKLLIAYYGFIIEIGGSIAAEYAEGRLRGVFDGAQFSPDMIAAFKKVKDVCDPGKTLNTGLKFESDVSQLKSMLRSSYSLDHQYNHLPRS